MPTEGGDLKNMVANYLADNKIMFKAVDKEDKRTFIVKRKIGDQCVVTI